MPWVEVGEVRLERHQVIGFAKIGNVLQKDRSRRDRLDHAWLETAELAGIHEVVDVWEHGEASWASGVQAYRDGFPLEAADGPRANRQALSAFQKGWCWAEREDARDRT